MRLVVQIPCFNEESTLPCVLAEIPRSIEGIDRIEVLVVDDGSTDRTAEVAAEAGVDHLVRFPRNRGLANAFVAGLEASLRAGADIIVNIDADGQYRPSDIPRLIAPILEGRAEIAIGSRPIGRIAHFSGSKKVLQKLGSWVVRVVSNTAVPDAPSGFRALSREAAMRTNVFGEYTYTLETIIQAGHRGMVVEAVPVEVNPPTRPSRLIASMLTYVRRSLLTIGRIFVTYRPFRFFALSGGLVFGTGLAISLRFLYFFFTQGGTGHIQSLILSALLMGTGFFLGVIGVLADLIAVNRKLLEDLKWRLQRIEIDLEHRWSESEGRSISPLDQRR